MKSRTAPTPNFTQIPNEWFDKWLREVETDAENKVIQIVMRFTFGWHDHVAGLSLDQFQELAGLSRSAVVDGIKKAMAHGFIERENNGHGRIYRMRTRGSITSGLKSSESQLSQESGDRTLNSSTTELFANESSNVLKKKKKKGRKVGVEIPIPDEMRELTLEMLKAAERAKAVGVNIEDEHESFVARADRDGLKYISWAGAWRTWLATAIKFKKERDLKNPPQAATAESRRPLHETIGEKKR
jgi:hypothetical protein